MKVTPDAVLDREQWLKPVEFSLPAGMIGFPEATRLELILNPEELPLMWLRSVDNHALAFLVVEPQGLIPGYTIELGDDDAARLDARDAQDLFIFNIVNFKPEKAGAATVNLIGPIVVNRRSLVGRQVIISNFADYSARHPLLAADAVSSTSS